MLECIPMTTGFPKVCSSFPKFEYMINDTFEFSTNGSRLIGFGFVSFSTMESANVAIASMNGAELRTKRLFVDLAKRKDELKQSEREHDDYQK